MFQSKIAETNPQDPNSCASFEWQWVEKDVFDSDVTLYRKLYESRGLYYDYYDNKVVADVGSGSGRFTYGLAKFSRARKIISVELSPGAIEKQKNYIKDDRVVFIQGDVATTKFQADVIFAAGMIQHTQNPLATLTNFIDNLNDGGEIFISFYLRTIATQVMEPLRFIFSKLPKRVLWGLTPLLAPLFMSRPEGRESGFKNAMHTAYDWFGSHAYQYYFTDKEIRDLFVACGIQQNNIIVISKGLYRAKKGGFPLRLDPTLRKF